MREKIQNTLEIGTEDIDLTALTDIEFYVSHKNFFGCYIPTVISPNKMVVIVPYEDAMKLNSGRVELQFAFTDANGVPGASDIASMTVERFLKEAGYDPVRGSK